MRGVVLTVLLASVSATAAAQGRERTFAPERTFTKDVAPILYTHCATCHRPGGAAPFSLLTYESARQRASLIASITARRIMPPWKADLAHGEFIGMDPLTETDITTIQEWVKGGASEGDSREMPALPTFPDGWQLGTPDLVVRAPAYTLPAEGTDVFRIFAIPLPVDGLKFVRGMEFRPGNTSVIHHATIRIDPTANSRRFDEQDPTPGYDGLIARTAGYPDGHFLGWTPGQTPPLLPKGLAWRLGQGTDLVVELHMQPTGKPEPIQPTIGFFFSDDPPQRTPTMLRLGRQTIEIAAGQRGHVVTDRYTLPVDAEVHAIQPHAHYRARTVHAVAALPGGGERTLLKIDDWDFRWQHVFRYVKPVVLPKGTTISMRITYDNSSANPRNPSPDRPVLWGQRSADEMADLWVQVLTRDEADRTALVRDFRPKMLAEDLKGYAARIAVEPESVSLHDDVALLHLEMGNAEGAIKHFAQSVVLAPGSAAARYNLGTALNAAGRTGEAAEKYREAIRLRAEYAPAHNNLGALLLQAGRTAEAVDHFERAIASDPSRANAHHNLGLARLLQWEEARGVTHLERAVELAPDAPRTLADLAWVLATARTESVRKPARAVALAERAAALTTRQDAYVLDVLGAAYAAAGRFPAAVAAAEAALELFRRAAADSSALGQIEARLTLYRSNRSFVLP